jgi:hypothetical protein
MDGTIRMQGGNEKRLLNFYLNEWKAPCKKSIRVLEDNHKILVWKHGVKLAVGSALIWLPFVNTVMNFRVP